MQIKVTADEIRQSAALLQLLEKWQRAAEISREYNGGKVTLATGVNKDFATVETLVDSYYLRTVVPKDAVGKCEQEIAALVGSRVTQLAKDVTDLIRAHMPLPM